MSLVVKNPPANARDVREVGFIPGWGRLPWRREWQSSPIFLPGEPHGHRSLVGLKESDTTKTTHTRHPPIKLNIKQRKCFSISSNLISSFYALIFLCRNPPLCTTTVNYPHSHWYGSSLIKLEGDFRSLYLPKGSMCPVPCHCQEMNSSL